MAVASLCYFEVGRGLTVASVRSSHVQFFFSVLQVCKVHVAQVAGTLMHISLVRVDLDLTAVSP